MAPLRSLFLFGLLVLMAGMSSQHTQLVLAADAYHAWCFPDPGPKKAAAAASRKVRTLIVVKNTDVSGTKRVLQSFEKDGPV